MHIGIVSPCDFGAFIDYIDENSKSKIIINNGWAPAVTTLVLSLLNSGCKVTIFSNHDIDKPIHLKGDNLNIYITPSYNKYPLKHLHGGWLHTNNLIECIKNNLSDIQLIHAHWTYEYALAASKFAHLIPIVCTVRDWSTIIWKYESFKNKIYWTFRILLCKKVFYNKNIKYIANSPYIESKIRRKKLNLIATIPNPINSKYIVSEKVENSDSFTMVSITHSNDKRKNILKLLKAFQLFRKIKSNAKLQLIGKPFVPDNLDMIKLGKNGLLNGVELIGSINHDKVFEILDKASLMVHPSLEESFGNILLEAMARRIPIIGGLNSGAVPYVLDHGKCGMLINVRSANDIFVAMQKVFNNKALSNEITNNATILLTERYSDKIILEKHLALYTKLINTHIHV